MVWLIVSEICCDFILIIFELVFLLAVGGTDTYVRLWVCSDDQVFIFSFFEVHETNVFSLYNPLP